MLHAQEPRSIRGQIKADTINAPVHIINVTLEKGTISNSKGEFDIKANSGDILLFSSVQFKKREILVNAEILKSEILEVRLEEELNELEQVNLHNLTGNLEKDIANIELVQPVNTIDLPPLEQIESNAIIGDAFMANQTQMLSTNGNLLEIAKLITGNRSFGILKSKNKNNNSLNERKVITDIKSRFDVNFFVDHLSLEIPQIENFIGYSIRKGLTEKLLEKENALDLIVFLEKTALAYKKELQ